MPRSHLVAIISKDRTLSQKALLGIVKALKMSIIAKEQGIRSCSRTYVCWSHGTLNCTVYSDIYIGNTPISFQMSLVGASQYLHLPCSRVAILICVTTDEVGKREFDERVGSAIKFHFKKELFGGRMVSWSSGSKARRLGSKNDVCAMCH